VLDVSRIVRGTLRLDIRRVNIGSVIMDALETVQPAREAKSIDVNVTLDPALPMIDADPDRLRQVLWNLLSNAVKFTGTGGLITVSAARVGDVVRVQVSDNGQGIAPDFLPLVFERFRQEDQSSAREHGGLGLGLAIVRHLVEAHGGSVAASSAGPGHGAQFTVDLPAVLRRRGTDTKDQRDRAQAAGA
jgi:signal transduction histidine kinase